VIATIDPGPGRELLGFKEAALSSFAFLSSYGFKRVQEESTLVRYESKTVFVNVYHGRGSYEIGIEIGRLDRPEKYGLEYIVSEAGKAAWESEGFGRSTMFQVSSRDGVQRFVPKVAELVKKYADHFLRGDHAFYDGLEKVNARRADEFTRQQGLARKRKTAEAAWQEKNYPKVVELYSSMREDLTSVEAGRLSYAAKQLPASGSVR
jgi:hypothetical protein